MGVHRLFQIWELNNDIKHLNKYYVNLVVPQFNSSGDFNNNY